MCPEPRPVVSFLNRHRILFSRNVMSKNERVSVDVTNANGKINSVKTLSLFYYF